MEIISNPWVVGIVGGILSGLIVAYVTRLLFSKRENREYVQKVSAVNKEVVYALRPGISEEEIPSAEVLSSLVNATARKYRINTSDAYSPKQIAEELIKEIMDSSFISAETKKNYCETLAHLVQDETKEKSVESTDKRKDLLEKEYKQKLIFQMSAMLGITVAMMTMATVFLTGLARGPDALPSPLADLTKVAFPTMAALVGMIVSMLSAMVAVRLRAIRYREKNGFGRNHITQLEEED